MKSKCITGGFIGLLTLAVSGKEVVGNEKYRYDAAGNIVEKQIGDKVVRFEYDGNLLKTNSQGRTYEHDHAGRLIGERHDEKPGRKLNWQFGDKVTSIENGEVRTDLFYNADGMLVGKNTDGEIETFAWDGLGLVLRGEEAFANEDHLSGGVAALAGERISVSDHLGSTLSLGGKSIEATAYGEGLEHARFTGKPYVKELGGFVFPYRLYSPEFGSWTVSDPSGFPDGSNSYAYVNGDPLSRIDPLGLAYEISVAATPPPNLSNSATTGSALTVQGKITNNVTPGPHPTWISVDYWTKGSGSGLFTSYSGEITGVGIVYCDAGNGNVSGYQSGGTWQRTGNAGAIATNVTCSAGTSSQEMTTSVKHAGTTSGSAGVTGAGFYGPGGAGVSLNWTGGASGIDCTTSCVYKSVEY